MQRAKDSFLMAMRERLGAINIARVVMVGGEARPGVIAEENESASEKLGDEIFRIRWGECKAAHAETPGLLRMGCAIGYASAGSAAGDGSDRGRRLGTMDTELRQMLKPASVLRRDYSADPATAVGDLVLWDEPVFTATEKTEARMTKTVLLNVYCFGEAGQP